MHFRSTFSLLSLLLAYLTPLIAAAAAAPNKAQALAIRQDDPEEPSTPEEPDPSDPIETPDVSPYDNPLYTDQVFSSFDPVETAVVTPPTIYNPTPIYYSYPPTTTDAYYSADDSSTTASGDSNNDSFYTTTTLSNDGQVTPTPTTGPDGSVTPDASPFPASGSGSGSGQVSTTRPSSGIAAKPTDMRREAIIAVAAVAGLVVVGL